LLSPQKLYNKKHGVFGHYQGDEDIFPLFLNNGPAIEVPYNSYSGLPIGYARTGATPDDEMKTKKDDTKHDLA
jgi:hypothetical protein